MDYSYLSNINGGVEDWLLRLRVCRLWESTNTRENTLISMDMVLIDEKGNLMHASVPRHLVSRFKRHVSECKLYSLRNVKITTNTYPSVTSTITLWGKLGELFDPTLYTQDGGPYVMVVTSVSVKTYQRALTFATTSASRIYVNPDEQHVSSVRERFSALSTKVLALEGTSASKLPLEEAMFVNQITLINKMAPGDNSPPAELQTLLGKQFVFKLALNKYNWVDGRQDYGVAAVYVPVPDLEAAYTRKKIP
ncbi:hypothetical protein DCAR_0934443 [Daucus carota subsp. sativus]|uniref:Replication protein A 70 kDa DNA-binding subunit B/D first OB fold domain-containing protein n=1 Tax=Daucus carota subsp. sativus TaxID=79200 RepID=A0AAF1BCR4_DAUCS|nr:hypothetical protein DCAR_0934443 [Daucus carota subsp. sativus]